MSRSSKTKTILLISSDSQTISLVREAVKGTAFRLSKRESGQKGLEAIPTVEPHLILSESHTEDMDGITVFRTFVEDHGFAKYKHIPFVLFSDGELRSLYGKELFDLGLSGWFTRPFGVRELREVLENLLTVNENISKNVELYQQVKRSEYRYRDLLENANDFIFTLDNEGRFVYLNNRFSPLTGYNKDAWLDKTFISLIVPADRDHTLQHYEMAHQGRARIFEARIFGSTPEPPVLSFNITSIFEKGSIVGSIGIARDVTEQKKMEKEILDLKNFNESIIQSMEAGLLTTNLSGTITSWNRGAEKILGWKAREVIGKKIKSILKPEEVDFLLSSPPPPGSLPYSRETEITVKSGRKIAIGFTTTDRIDNRNKKVGAIVSFRDITQLKQMQSEVIRMDRLASLGVLASGIAHEIKNPLAGIKTMAQACEEEFEEDDSRKEYLTRIVRQVNRLDDLLKTFFAYARPKPPDRKPHTLSEILREVTNLVSKKMATSRVSYIEKLNSNLPEVLVDSQQIQQVFLNLILNALDAMSDGGTLTISSKGASGLSSGLIQRRRGGWKGKNNAFVEVVVQDTGGGIQSDVLKTIFDPFFTTKPNGLGLGLSIVYRIIEEHGGDIHVETEIGRGTSFTITLPVGD